MDDISDKNYLATVSISYSMAVTCYFQFAVIQSVLLHMQIRIKQMILSRTKAYEIIHLKSQFY